MAVRIEYKEYLEGSRSWEKAEESRPKIFADSRWAWRFEQARARSRYERLAEPLARNLENALSGLEKALGNFSWPDDDLPFAFKRSTQADAALNGKLTGQAVSAEESNQYYKYFSRGRDADSNSGLDAGTYRFDVTLGNKAEQVEIEVGSQDTWGDVLENVAGAVNDLGLPVQAEVIVQHNPYQKISDLGKTGSILAFSVDPGREAQNLSINDTTGLLTHNLDLEKTNTPALPATTRTYNLTGNSDAEPTAFYSSGVDPNADAGLDAGTHKLAYSIGGESGTFEIDVDEDMTWGDLLTKTADVINSTSNKVEAKVLEVDIFSGLDDPLYTQGRSIEIKAKDPKLGEKLSLSNYGDSWLDPVDEFFDPVGTLPSDPNTGDRYIAESTANGWTQGRIYEWDGSNWQETAPSEGNALYAREEGADYFYDGSAWSTAPSGNLTEVLGFRQPNPGMDATLTVNGETTQSATGTFSADNGRLTMDLQDSFGERLPLKVMESMEKLTNDFSDAITAYNELQEFLEPNKDLFREDFVENWRDTVRDNQAELSWLGISEVGDEGMLIADTDAFWRAAGSNPERAKQLLLGQDGLFSSWNELADNARSPDASNSLIPQAYLQNVSAPASTIFENEKRSDLQQLIDSELADDSPNKTTEMELNILKAVASEPTELERLMGENSLDIPGGIIKSRG